MNAASDPNPRKSFGVIQTLDTASQERWGALEGVLRSFNESVGDNGDQSTQVMYVSVRPCKDVDTEIERINQTREKNEPWGFMVISGKKEDSRSIMACPMRGITKKNIHTLPYIEIHSTAVAWWLINSWRAIQLSEATWHLANNYQAVPAAACARSLLETAASFWGRIVQISGPLEFREAMRISTRI